ncbi:MAG: hypothetical protein A2Z34_05955 [Planctomycetes bacterium RBG_16_59_8]|nr:MAG: hypothetical protein A2Z34_05955 [Planctomycetes bacterium RBG_16_59_8]
MDVKPDGEKATLAAVLETSKGKIVIDLSADESPNTVMNFCNLTRKGYYNGMFFHRVIKDFVAQTGCPIGQGTGGPGYSVESEKEGAMTKHEPGTVSMSHYEKTGFTGSQFFVCLKKLPILDAKYSILGKAADAESLKVIEEIGKVQTDPESDKPKTNVDLKKVSLTTK